MSLARTVLLPILLCIATSVGFANPATPDQGPEPTLPASEMNPDTHYLGNRLLTFVTNVLYNTMLTDMETCYKVMRTEVLRSMTLRSNGFGIEPEMTAKIFKRGYRVYEVPITYDGRGYEEGKKIGWRDGVVALWVLVRYRFSE